MRDLTEISSQIQAAVIVSTDGMLLASTLADDAAARRLADAAVGLVDAAASVPHESNGEGFVQLEAATLEGSVFVVRDGERAAAAVTSLQPTAGLVFFDLKSCLRTAAAEDGDGKPRPKPRRTRAKATEDGR